MNVLGLSAFGGESAAALIVEGKLVAAFAEEELSAAPGIGFPWAAAARCLEAARVSGANLEAVALAHKPLLHLDRVLRNALAHAPSGWPRFADDMARWRPSTGLPSLLRARLGFDGPVLYVERPEALALAALADAPAACAVLVAGARGERCDGALGAADGTRLALTRRLGYPHGLGPLWDAFGHYLAARKDPWRALPELAARGAPRFAGRMLERLVDVKPDGSLRLDLGYFSSGTALEPTNARFWALFGRPPRQPNDPAGAWAADVAASLQAVTVEALRRMAAEARRRAGHEELCLVGDAARNEPALEALRESRSGGVHAGSPPRPLAAAIGAAAAAWQRGVQRGRPELPPSVWTSPPPAGTRRAPAAGGARSALRRLGVGAAAALTLAAAGGLAAAYFGLLTPLSLVARTLGFSPLPERWRARGSYWTDAAAPSGLTELRRPG